MAVFVPTAGQKVRYRNATGRVKPATVVSAVGSVITLRIGTATNNDGNKISISQVAQKGATVGWIRGGR
jgi:hypothetical protein